MKTNKFLGNFGYIPILINKESCQRRKKTLRNIPDFLFCVFFVAILGQTLKNYIILPFSFFFQLYEIETWQFSKLSLITIDDGIKLVQMFIL